MTKWRNVFKLLLLALVLAVSPNNSGARAGASAALVLDVIGLLVPVTEAFDQLADKATLHLEPGARLTFSHYRLCQKVALRGPGKLEMSTGNYSWSGEQPAKIENRQCLNVVVYVDPDLKIAGTLLRQMAVMKVDSRPFFVIADFDSAHEYAILLRRTGEGQPEIRLPLAKKATYWPEGLAPLDAGSSYFLTLVRDSQQSRKPSLVSVSASDGSTKGRNPLILSFP